MPLRIPVMHMRWKHLSFIHFQVDAKELRRHVPEPLELDLFQGEAWLAIVPFLMTETYPLLPGGSLASRAVGAYEFPELNVRTYVKHGGRSGVYFFSLDATSKVAVRVARRGYLPYRDAQMRCDPKSDARVDYKSHRVDPIAPPADFDASYWATGPVFNPAEGTREHFLTERYSLFAVTPRGTVLRTDIQHKPWPLQPGGWESRVLNQTPTLPFELAPKSALVHFASDQKVIAFAPSLSR